MVLFLHLNKRSSPLLTSVHGQRGSKRVVSRDVDFAGVSEEMLRAF